MKDSWQQCESDELIEILCERDKQIKILSDALKECAEIIHDEFCGRCGPNSFEHHPFCDKAQQALKDAGIE